ncbi:MAG: hypothetical protein LBV28_04655, partial [Puniceicoccales bacterium]|nr:hypothetical protein [Puniceicoccales bacterium]
MTNERTKGWIGTLAIHGLFVGALVLFSGLHSPDIEAPSVGSLVLNLTGDGSPLGVGGGNSPVPQGNPDASPAAPAEAPLFDPSTISKHIEKIKREQERVQAQPPVQPTAPVPPPKPKPDRPTRPPVPSPTGEHTTLSEFLAKNPT